MPKRIEDKSVLRINFENVIVRRIEQLCAEDLVEHMVKANARAIAQARADTTERMARSLKDLLIKVDVEGVVR